MVRYRTGVETERGITEAITELLAEGGFEAATVRAICERAGIQVGSFYNLFESKEVALLAVVSEVIRAFDPDPDGTGRYSTAELAAQYVAFVRRQPDIARIYLQLGFGPSLPDRALSSRIVSHNERRVARFAAAISEEHHELSQVGVEQRARVIVAGLNGLAFHWLLDDGLDIGALSNELVACCTGAGEVSPSDSPLRGLPDA